MTGKQSCGGKMRGQDRQKRKRKSAWEQQELKQALQLSKIEAWRDDLRLAGTARSAILFVDADSQLQLLPKERE